jgi:hypothetical protein
MMRPLAPNLLHLCTLERGLIELRLIADCP